MAKDLIYKGCLGSRCITFAVYLILIGPWEVGTVLWKGRLRSVVTLGNARSRPWA